MKGEDRMELSLEINRLIASPKVLFPVNSGQLNK